MEGEQHTPIRRQYREQHFNHTSLGRVKAFTLGYDREFAVIPHVATAFGGQVSVYGTPDLPSIMASAPATMLQLRIMSQRISIRN